MADNPISRVLSRLASMDDCLETLSYLDDIDDTGIDALTEQVELDNKFFE
jgi:hypothetical protein